MSEEIHRLASSPNWSILQQEAQDARLASFGLPTDDHLLLEKLRNGDEEAFVSLIGHYHTPMLRLVMIYLPDRSLAEEVVQETWLGVLQGLKHFAGRSSLKTWIFRILINQAKTRAQREGRSVSFSSLSQSDSESSEPEVNPERFLPLGSPMVPGRGLSISLPDNWDDLPEEHLLSQETQACINMSIDALPPQQREVITLRDIAGWESFEEHLAGCIGCTNYVEQMQRTIGMLRTLTEKPMFPETKEELRQAFQNWKKNELSEK